MSTRMPRCAVRGSINVDEYFFVDKITLPGETKSSKGYTSRIGGKGANQAVAMAQALGGSSSSVTFYGSVGKDRSDEWIEDNLTRHGVGREGFLVVEEPTGRAIIQVADDGENSIVLFPGANHSQLHESDPQYLTGGQTTHLLLQNEIHPASTLQALRSAKPLGVTTILNPSPLPSASEIRLFPWDTVDWLVVNEGEASGLLSALRTDINDSTTPDPSDALSLDEHGRTLQELSRLSALASTNIVCTLGPAGVLATLATRSLDSKPAQTIVHVPAVPPRGTLRDTTGAGDCFTGWFVAGLMAHYPSPPTPASTTITTTTATLSSDALEQILRKCTLAASMSVEKPGTIDSYPTQDAVNSRIREMS